MATYLSHFGFKQLPFSLTPNTQLFHGLPPHYEALQTVLTAVDMGEGITKVVGEVGTGKTLLCRMLLKYLPSDVQLIYLPNPMMSATELRQAVARELGLALQLDNSLLIDDIHQALLTLRADGKKVLALIDEAQTLSDEAIEALRLFGNLETEQDKLLQLVLLGQPELELRLSQHHLRQFRQRISFNAELRALSLSETVAYIEHRLHICGGDVELLSLRQKKAIWKATGGIPRTINQVCHKALLMAYLAQKKRVKNQHLLVAMQETYDVKRPKFNTLYLWGWK